MGQQALPLRTSATPGRILAGLSAGLLFCSFSLGVGQVPSAADPTPPQTGLGSHRSEMGRDPTEPSNPFGPANAARMQKMREEERHKKLVADTARLVALTGELKAEVDKATKDELSLDVIRKAAEIEKLARDVKERMKG